MKLRQARKIYFHLDFNVMCVTWNPNRFPSSKRVRMRTIRRMESAMRRAYKRDKYVFDKPLLR